MIKKVIEIDVEQVKALGGLNALQESLKETETKSVSLKTELKKLKDQLAQLPEGTAEYNKIAEKAGQVSDKIGDINQKIKNLGSDTRGIDTVVQGTQVLSGAFSVATSASALLGSENKELQETMLKVESAIGLTVGVQSIANALQKESALVIGVSNIATKAQVAIQGAYALAVGTTTGALKAFRLALATTGIGALVVGLGFLISKLTESSNVTEDATVSNDAFNKSLNDTKSLFSDLEKAIENKTKVQVLRAKIAGASESELQSIEQKGINDKIDNLELEKKLLNDRLNNRKLSAEQYSKTVEDLDRIDDAIFDKRNEKEISSLNLELEVANKRRDAQEKSKQESLKKAEEEKQKRIEIEKTRNEALLKESQEFFERAKESQSEYDKEQQRQIDEFKAPETEEDKANIEAARRVVEIENLQGTLSQKKSLLEEYNSFVLTNEELTETSKAQFLERGLQYKKIIQKQELDLLQQSFGKISKILGENSKAGKAFAIGQALINTYQGITAELATKAVTPYELGLKIVNVAYIAKTGFDAVKQIKKAGNGGSGGGSTGGVSSAGSIPTVAESTPQFNLVSQSGTNQLSQTIANQQNRPIQTYVVGNQVTTQQSLDRNALQTSVFG